MSAASPVPEPVLATRLGIGNGTIVPSLRAAVAFAFSKRAAAVAGVARLPPRAHHNYRPPAHGGQRLAGPVVAEEPLPWLPLVSQKFCNWCKQWAGLAGKHLFSRCSELARDCCSLCTKHQMKGAGGFISSTSL